MRKILTAATLSLLFATMSCGDPEAGEWQLPPSSAEAGGKASELRPLNFGPSCEMVLAEWQIAYYRDLGDCQNWQGYYRQARDDLDREVTRLRQDTTRLQGIIADLCDAWPNEDKPSACATTP